MSVIKAPRSVKQKLRSETKSKASESDSDSEDEGKAEGEVKEVKVKAEVKDEKTTPELSSLISEMKKAAEVIRAVDKKDEEKDKAYVKLGDMLKAAPSISSLRL